ncbi:MAG: nucleotidyltransferase domain-containing protein [Lentisphaeria bacterium]|nr:nucleotidyltransferase domain-containing protein [Lentisphaeria bacterium]
MLPILKAQESVRRIILFGSLARGRVGERSDVDLVVVQETDQPVLSRVEELYRLVLPEVDMDILVYTPAEFEQLRESRGFVRRLLREGKVLYEPTP